MTDNGKPRALHMGPAPIGDLIMSQLPDLSGAPNVVIPDQVRWSVKAGTEHTVKLTMHCPPPAGSFRVEIPEGHRKLVPAGHTIRIVTEWTYSAEVHEPLRVTGQAGWTLTGFPMSWRGAPDQIPVKVEGQ